MPKEVLVTGGAGFIGSHLVDELVDLEYKVYVMDDLSTGRLENLNQEAVFLNLDISNSVSARWAINPEYIFHLAAIPRIPYSIKEPVRTHEVNVNGTLNILELARKCNAKVIFASSSSVYGDTTLPFREGKAPKPISPYALHKLIGEKYMKLYCATYGVPTVSLRFFNVYGPRARADSEYSLVIGKFKRLKKEKKPLTIYGDGKQSRDFTYVSDVVEACILAMEKPVKNQVINICGGKATTINKIADLIGGKKTYLPPRKGDVKHTLGCSKKAKKLLGWKPKITIKKGLKLI